MFHVMKVKTSTHRLEAQLEEALNHLCEITRRTKNSLINEAVSNLIKQKGLELESELEETLKKLRSYREKDPDFEQAITTFARAEAEEAGHDPVEGVIPQSLGTVQTEVRELFHA